MANKGWNGRGFSAVIYENATAVGDGEFDGTDVLIEVRLDDPMPLEGYDVLEIMRSKPADTYEQFRDRMISFVLPDGFRSLSQWPHGHEAIDPSK